MVVQPAPFRPSSPTISPCEAEKLTPQRRCDCRSAGQPHRFYGGAGCWPAWCSAPERDKVSSNCY